MTHWEEELKEVREKRDYKEKMFIQFVIWILAVIFLGSALIGC